MSKFSNKSFTPKVLTACDLLHGDAVYWSRQGYWALRFSDAVFLTDRNMAEALLAGAEADAGRVFGAYLVDAEIGDDGLPRPVHLREQLRAAGPGNLFHGKQADPALQENAHV